MSIKIITKFFTKIMKSLTLFSYQKQSNYFYKIIEILFNVYIKLEIKFENRPMSKKYTSESLSWRIFNLISSNIVSLFVFSDISFKMSSKIIILCSTKSETR